MELCIPLQCKFFMGHAHLSHLAMIPIDYKITFFSLYLFVYFFDNNYNMFNSLAPLDHKYYFRIKLQFFPYPIAKCMDHTANTA